MKLINRYLFAGTFALLATVTNVSATDVTLADLLVPGATYTVGDLTFYDFANVTQTGDITVDLSSISVQPYQIGNDYGIRFQTGLWILTGAGKSYDLALSFKVTSSGNKITGNELSFTGGITGGAGQAVISETINTSTSQTLGTEVVSLAQTSDSDTFAGQDTLLVTKDFAMSTDVEADSDTLLTVSHFNQLFIEEVPEPSSMVLLGLGVAGLAILRRKAARK